MIAHGEVEQARRILADLEGLDVNDEHVTTDVKEIEFAVVFEREHGVFWGDLLRGRIGDQTGTSTIRRLVLGMGTQIMQQLSGIKRNFLLPLHGSHLIRRSLQRPCSSPRSVQLSILSPLQLSRHSKRRKLGSQKPHDVSGSRPGILLRPHHRPHSLL